MTVHAMLVPNFTNLLGALSNMLDKVGDDALLDSKLADDMFPLAAQIRVSCDQAVQAIQRLSGKTLDASPDNDTSIAAAKARIAATIAWLGTIDEADLAADESAVSFELPNGMAFDMTAFEYARDWSLSQFYFHVIAAYAIMRNQGVALGKADYVPFMFKYLRKAPATA